LGLTTKFYRSIVSIYQGKLIVAIATTIWRSQFFLFVLGPTWYVASDSLTLHVRCNTLLIFKKIFPICKGDRNRQTPTEPTGMGQSIGLHRGPAKDMVIVLLILTLKTTKKYQIVQGSLVPPVALSLGKTKWGGKD
jgi:hypothetical protein